MDEARLSEPPALHTRVRILRPGWANGATGVVVAHGELGERDRGRDGRRVRGRDCVVRLDAAIPTRWDGHPLTEARRLFSWDLEVIG